MVGLFDLIKQIKMHCINVEKRIQADLNLSEAEFTALRIVQSHEVLLNREFAKKKNESFCFKGEQNSESII